MHRYGAGRAQRCVMRIARHVVEVSSGCHPRPRSRDEALLDISSAWKETRCRRFERAAIGSITPPSPARDDLGPGSLRPLEVAMRDARRFVFLFATTLSVAVPHAGHAQCLGPSS